MKPFVHSGKIVPGRCACSVRGTHNFPTYHQCRDKAVTLAPWGEDSKDLPVCNRHSVKACESRRIRGEQLQNRSRQYWYHARNLKAPAPYDIAGTPPHLQPYIDNPPAPAVEYDIGQL